MTSSLCVLLTNDDGIDAPGLLALCEAFKALPNVEVYVAAPDRERSTCSHGMTLGKDVAVLKREENVFAVDGLPVDCVYLGGNGLFPRVPDVVVSGINRGANLGSDVIFSGTVAGARQAALQGISGIAVSLVDGDDFSVAARMTASLAVRLAGDLRNKKSTGPILLNLNFPDGTPGEIRFAKLGGRHYPQMITQTALGVSNRRLFRLGGPAVEDAMLPGTDGFLISRGIASATLLTVDQGDLAKMADPAYALVGIAPMDGSEPQNPN